MNVDLYYAHAEIQFSLSKLHQHTQNILESMHRSSTKRRPSPVLYVVSSYLGNVLGFLVVFTVNPWVHPHRQALQRPSVPQPRTHTYTRAQKTHTHTYRERERERDRHRVTEKKTTIENWKNCYLTSQSLCLSIHGFLKVWHLEWTGLLNNVQMVTFVGWDDRSEQYSIPAMIAGLKVLKILWHTVAVTCFWFCAHPFSNFGCWTLAFTWWKEDKKELNEIQWHTLTPVKTVGPASFMEPAESAVHMDASHYGT